ncbi:MAG: diacylglycerol kinase [Pseudomonadota bacterium]
MKPGKTGITRIVDATGYSLKGLRACYRGEAAFRQEFWAIVVLTPISFWLAGNAIEWILLMAPLMLLLIVELLNSAVEAAIDRIGEEKHVLSGRAKDMGSAAVLLSLLLIAMTWLPIAYQRFQEFA